MPPVKFPEVTRPGHFALKVPDHWARFEMSDAPIARARREALKSAKDPVARMQAEDLFRQALAVSQSARRHGALWGAGTAACFALASYSTIRALLVAAAAGAIGAGVYGALVLGSLDSISASAIAATLVGFCGGVLARRLKVTPLVVAVSGITPLLPGLSTYRGLYELATEATGIPRLIGAVAIGLALAAGVVLGEYLAQPVRSGLGRLERKLSGPRMAGPIRP